MRKAFFRILPFIFCAFFAHAEAIDLPLDCILVEDFFEEGEILEPRGDAPKEEPVPQPSYLENVPSSLIAGRVNAINGDLVESQVDLFLPGPKPLLVQRSWDGRKKRWHFGHFSKLRVTGNDPAHMTAYYTDDAGSMIPFHKSRKTGIFKIPKRQFKEGLTNCGSGEISGQTHWRNTILSNVRRQGGFRRKLLRHGTGVDRFFRRTKSKHYCLDEERHPGSVRFLYGYEKGKLRQVQCLDAEENLLQELSIEKIPIGFLWSSGDQKVSYHYQLGQKRLHSVSSSQMSPTNYTYDSKKRLSGKIQHSCYQFSAKYDKKDRVRSLQAPVGKEGRLAETHRFSYGKHRTDVTDALGHRTRYIHRKKRLSEIVRYDGDEPFAKEKFVWDRKGKLCRRQVKEGEQLLFETSLSYDRFGNIMQETLSGDLTGTGKFDSFTKTFQTTQDGWNQPLEENDGRQRIRFSYYPETNLLKSRLTGSQTETLKREFFVYDRRGTCIQEILDDGSGEDVEDLTGVTERHLKTITPTQSAPYGLPEKVEEFYLSSGKYCPLRTTIFRYSSHGKKIAEEHYDSEGAHTFTLKWEYDPHGNRLSETDALGKTIFYTYDTRGNKITEQHPHLLKQFAYDKANRLIEEKERWPDGTTLATTYRYNVLGQKQCTVDPFGNETYYNYDALGRRCMTMKPPIHGSPLFRIEREIHNVLGHKVRSVDALGRITHTRYTARGQVSEIRHPDGTTVRKEYSPEGHLIKEIAENGRETHYTRDLFGRITRTESAGKVASRVYNTFHLLSKTDELGCTTYYTYDGAGRKIRKTKGASVTAYFYDTLGRRTKTIQWIDGATARVSCKEYDLLDRITEERTEELDGSVSTKVCYSYDNAGNRSEVVTFDEEGAHAAQTLYTLRDKPALEVDPLGYETRTEYAFGSLLTKNRRDPLGTQEVSIEDAEGHLLQTSFFSSSGELLSQETYQYDRLGRKIDIETLGKRSICWEYDSGGRIVRCTESPDTPEEKTTRYFYNSCGEKIETRQANGVSLYHAYDLHGRTKRLSSSDGSIDWIYHYDAKDNPIEIENKISGKSTLRSYDPLGNLISETLETGLRVDYSYDPLNRLTQVSLPGSNTIRYSYSGCRLLSVARFKGDACLYTHSYTKQDLSGHCTEETLIGSAGRIVRSFDARGSLITQKTPHRHETLSYDPVGNLISKEAQELEIFLYDPLHRLIEENSSIPHNYAYDADSNRSQKDGKAYRLNTLNELLEDQASSYAYDANGNCISRTQNGIATRFAYDALNRLIRVNTPDQEISYTYDPLHRRLTKQKECYLYQGESEIGTVVDGELQSLRILGKGLAADIGSAIAIELDQTYVPVHDVSGNICQLLDMEGNPIETARYSAFGESLNPSRSPWRFSSKRFDPETGFVYFGRRYYVPETGRWLTPDPAGFEDGLNLYAYVHNAPLTRIDPDGQLAFLIPIVANIALSCAIDYALPYAVAYLEQYACGAVAGAALTGLAHGYNGTYTCSELLFGSATMTGAERFGLITGAVLGVMPSRAGSKAVSNIAKSQLASYATGQVATKSVKVVTHLAENSARQCAKNAAVKTAQKTNRKAVDFFCARNINPLSDTNYTKKVLMQMEKNLITGQPDFHGFPRIVDNYAHLARREWIVGRDGISRLKLSLNGSYKQMNGHFEWILEADKSVNHRLFVPIR